MRLLLMLLAAWALPCSTASAEPPQASRPAPIIDGTADTEPSHQAVALIRLRVSQGTATCTGTLIAPRVVLTAAHCFEDLIVYGLSSFQVGFGANDTGAMQWVEGIDHLTHPDYYPTTHRNDTALIRLAWAPVGVTPLPILPESHDFGATSLGTPMGFVGYGRTNASEAKSVGVRMALSLPIDSICAPTEPDCTKPYGPILAPIGSGQLCFRASDASASPCLGDSGGPVFLKVDGVDQIAATTSFGDTTCDTFTCASMVNTSSTAEVIRSYVADTEAILPTKCSPDPAADGTACDDGDPGTVNDVCRNGACHGTVPPPSPSRPPAHGCATTDAPLDSLTLLFSCILLRGAKLRSALLSRGTPS